MKLRPRLLVVSLAVAAIASLAIGWALSRMDTGSAAADEQVTFDSGAAGGGVEPPSIGTNAAVQGAALPAVRVQTLSGDDVATIDLLGQPLVINVWGSTCGPCKKELPDFAAAHAIYGDRVRFVGIDYLPPSAREEAFARDRGVQYELLYDTNGDFVSQVGIAAFPVTLFVDSDGTIVRQTGQLDLAELSSLIETHLLT